MAKNKPKPEDWNLEDHIRGVIYGNCIGDAIGLLSEFMVKSEAKRYYGKKKGKLEYQDKVPDMHRARWENGDWTDDSDQMILIMDSILDNNGKVDHVDYGRKVLKWARHGFEELGDLGGMGLGATTHYVLKHPKFEKDPHAAAQDIWTRSGCDAAPNGAAMRTSVAGVYEYMDLDKVEENTLQFCKITHADPRCQATVVAITTAIALMLQRHGKYKVEEIIDEAFNRARKYVAKGEGADALQWYMHCTDIKELKLDEHGKIGYTYKALGAGFWALRQQDFRTAMETIVFEAGDADSNGAVAGALLGCKLGASALPSSWLKGLVHKEWLDKRIDRFLQLVIPEGKGHPPRGEAEKPVANASILNRKEEVLGQPKEVGDRSECFNNREQGPSEVQGNKSFHNNVLGTDSTQQYTDNLTASVNPVGQTAAQCKTTPHCEENHPPKENL